MADAYEMATPAGVSADEVDDQPPPYPATEADISEWQSRGVARADTSERDEPVAAQQVDVLQVDMGEKTLPPTPGVPVSTPDSVTKPPTHTCRKVVILLCLAGVAALIVCLSIFLRSVSTC